MQIFHLPPMIILTFVTVCEMERSYKIRYHRDFEYIPSSPPSLGIIQTKVGIQQFSTCRVFESSENLGNLIQHSSVYFWSGLDQ